MSNERAVVPMEIVVRTLQAPQMQGIIKQALPPNVTLDRFTRATLTAIQQNPSILEADRNSLYNAITRCAQDGLMPDGRQAAIVTFSTKVKTPKGDVWVKKAQHMPMVEGIIYQLAKSGISAYAVSVYENDEFEAWNDENGQHVKHRPTKLGATRGPRIGAYATGKTKDGWVYVEVMDMDDLEVPKRATKQRDKDGNLTGPWKDTPDRMEQKSCLHRLAKRIPSAALRDDDEFNESPPSATDVPAPPSTPAETPPPEQPKRSRALQAVIDAGGEYVQAVTPEPAQDASVVAEQSRVTPDKASESETPPAAAGKEMF